MTQLPLVILACGLYLRLLEDGPLFLQQGLNEHLSLRTRKQHASNSQSQYAKAGAITRLECMGEWEASIHEVYIYLVVFLN